MTSQQPEPTDQTGPPPELVAYLRQFRGTQRGERMRRENPDAAAEADRLDRAAAARGITVDPLHEMQESLRQLRETETAAIDDAAVRRHANSRPVPVEIRRPNWTPREFAVEVAGTALASAIRVVIVRAAARRIFGVQLTRRDAWLLAAAISATTRGGGAYRLWTRETPRQPR